MPRCWPTNQAYLCLPPRQPSTHHLSQETGPADDVPVLELCQLQRHLNLATPLHDAAPPFSFLPPCGCWKPDNMAALGSVQGKWLPELRRIVATVNNTFGRAFAKIGCAGEVVLHLEDDYERCAINIKCVSAN